MHYHIARAVVHMEHLFGSIPYKFAKGSASCHILNTIEMLENEDNDYVTEHPLSEIH